MASLQTFAENMSDKARELPNFKELALPGIKETVAQLLQMIGRTEGIFSTYTKHDISHVDAMLEMLGWLIPQSTKEIMTGIEALGIRLGVQRWRDQEVQVARGCMTEYGPFVAMLGE